MIESKVRINDIDISYKMDGKGRPIVLLHGIFATKEIMNPLFDYYKENYLVISYDLRGHGQSDKPERFNIDDHAHDLKEIIKHFGLEKPVVIGLSMGSFVTLRAAEVYPLLMSRIVLIGVKGKGSMSLMQRAIEQNNGDSNIDLKQMGRLISNLVYPPNTTPQQIQEYYKGNRGVGELTNDERRNIYLSLSEYDMMSDIDRVAYLFFFWWVNMMV